AAGSERVGILVAGSNLQQRDTWENTRRQAAGRAINPRYGLAFLDSGQVGCLGEIFALRGLGYSVGGASASGSLAIFQAWHWLRSGLLDACLVVGANSDLSPLELEAFELLGALGGAGWEDRPEQACRPFDRRHGGFLWGQGSGALLLERQEAAAARGAPLLGEILGAAVAMDGNHLPDSSAEGELRAMRGALAAAGLGPEAVDYVNAHATSTPLGDETECAALRSLFGARAGAVRVNATKGLTGHCLSAAGVVETVACLLQLEGGFLHPNRNLVEPIDPLLGFVGARAEPASPRVMLKNGFGFGGFNSSLLLAPAAA
ncbi:MAG: beta-ketoacyl synthase N-terminal-like domain-containing protein, partial [Tistlia sp.]